MHRIYFIAFTILVCFQTSRATAQQIYTIGNSLTGDTLVLSLDGIVRHSTYCGRNLQYIFDNPNGNCGGLALTSFRSTTLEFDFVTVQPFTGTTLQQDIDVISSFMELQPNADFVIHAGWSPEATFASDYLAGNPNDTYRPSPEYINALRTALEEIDPDRTFTETRSNELLFSIHLDIENGIGPFDDLSDLYRDHIHMNDKGRYVMHNAMRIALGQPVADTGAVMDPEERAYLDGKLAELTAEPTILLGDANLDGSFNVLDILPFISLLSNGEFRDEADMNRDGSVNALDISGFIALLSQQ